MVKHDHSDLTGKKFNRLTVIKDTGERYINGGKKYLCICECGNETNVRADSLKNSHVKSCGCYNKEATFNRLIIHGHNITGKTSPEYHCWHGMIQRCTNANHQSYHNYGGRGIKVCSRWRVFTNFLGDMGLRPSLKHSLDRYPDNDGNYRPGNVRWATMKQQSRNKRTNRWLYVKNQKLTLRDWSRLFKTSETSILTMLGRDKRFEEVHSHYMKKIKK